MYSTRYVPGQQSTSRKSRLEGKPSLLPKPRRTGSTEPEIRRPSGAGHRSSSAEPPRATLGGRLSREPSATNLPPISSRSKSQQSEMRYGASHYMSTPLHSNHNARSTNTPLEFRLPTSELKHGVTPLRYSHNLTTTPRRTVGDESSGRSWEQALDRVLAFVTVKDQRPLSNAGWQRAAAARVGEALALRASEGGKALALLRPLTIARFVDIVADLLGSLYNNPTLNTDNYVTKLPHITKRLLYPGTVSKSWLRTVNTLHAFPHALALIAYLLDLIHFCESPIEEGLIYLAKDDFADLKQDFIFRSWQRFQMPEYQFDDLSEEYLQNLKTLLGNDDEKIQELENKVKKQESELEDEAEAAARADVCRREERLSALLSAVRAERAASLHDTNITDDARAARQRLLGALGDIDAEVERAHVESQRLCEEVSAQSMSVSERAQLLEQVDYAFRVHDSKTALAEHISKCGEPALCEEVSAQSMSVSERAQLLEQVDYAFRVHDSKTALAEHISKMLLSKETELAGWQKRTLDSCVQYKQALIHLAPHCPDLASYNIDEKTVVDVGNNNICCTNAQPVKYHDHTEDRRQVEREKTEAARSAAELAAVREQIAGLQAAQAQHKHLDTELEFWQQQDVEWRSKLSSLQEYVVNKRTEVQQTLAEATNRRVQLLLHNIRLLNEKLPN
ncbi:Kinetochore protein NDC80-like [Papilio machaon]|uniref:Kinetochore protein NDC80 n=1 Tax=Papilio machaon TaxID=76193 RepID=A0A194RCF3_PAPMA|nr:Kinetochore protein NDC80-like [Papilio machaon]